MFARWSQENFFKYMRGHYHLDRLVDYSLEQIPESTKVVNPKYREADGKVRKLAAQLSRKRCKCNELILCDDIEPNKVEEYETKKQVLLEEVEQMALSLVELKNHRRATSKHVKLSDLPEEDRFKMLGMKSKYFIDVIKLVAYRTETAMVNIARQTMRRQDEARNLLRSLYSADADIIPDYAAETLTVRLHQPANKCSAIIIGDICRQLNATNTEFPGTKLRLSYELVS